MAKLARLDLDFSPAAGRPSPWGMLLLVAGVVVAVLAGVQYESAEAARIRSAGDLADASSRGPNAAHGAVADARAARAAAKVARELQMPWSELLSTLEGVSAKDVTLLAAEPSASRQTLRITAEAKNADAMLDYLAALHRTRFSEVMLTSHHMEQETPGTPVRFVIQARWGGGSGAEATR